MALNATIESFVPPAIDQELWYVTNGERVVGPVATELLLRGITHGRVPEDCMVRQPEWAAWRALEQIREVAPLRRPPGWCEAPGPDDTGAPTLIARARYLGEAFLFALHACIARTNADVGLVHRVRAPFVGLVTSCAHGTGMDVLGEVLPSYDPALATARAGVCALGAPEAGDVERAVARRLENGERTLRGIAMVPVRTGTDLVAMIELGRFDHPLRQVDLAATREIAAETMARLTRLLQTS